MLQLFTVFFRSQQLSNCGPQTSLLVIVCSEGKVSHKQRLNLHYAFVFLHTKNPGSSVGIVIGLQDGRLVFNSRKGQYWEFFSSLPRPGQLWGRSVKS
jgi:hypothetical protein